VKKIVIIILFNITLNLFSQVDFILNFDFEGVLPIEEIENIWIDDLNNDDEDEMYVLLSNDNDGYWKLFCLDLVGNILWTYNQDYQEFSKFTNGLIFNFNNSQFFVTRNVSWIDYEWWTDIYFDFKIYNWNNLALIDSISIFSTTIHSMGNQSSYSLDVPQIKPVMVNNMLKIYVGDEITSLWDDGSFNGGSISNRMNIFSFNNNILNFEETIVYAGANILCYDDYDSIISFGYRSIWDNYPDTRELETSQYLKTISYEFPPVSTDILTLENKILKLLTENDTLYTEFGLLVLQTNDNSEFFYQCYTPDFSDTLWTSYQLGFLNDDYVLTNSTCVTTNLGNNYILYFGNLDNNYILEVRNRTTGAIALTQSTDINPEYIIKGNNGILYFIEKIGYQQNLQIYTLQDEIYVSCNNNQINDSFFKISNYPNPFNPSTTIKYSIQNDSNVKLTIFNVKGQKIKTLVQNEFPKGNHSVIWNGNDELGKPVSSGVYYYQLNINGRTEFVNKCLLLK